jgi:hypothetical protein
MKKLYNAPRTESQELMAQMMIMQGSPVEPTTGQLPIYDDQGNFGQ